MDSSGRQITQSHLIALSSENIFKIFGNGLDVDFLTGHTQFYFASSRLTFASLCLTSVSRCNVLTISPSLPVCTTLYPVRQCRRRK